MILAINCSLYYFYNNIYKYGNRTSLETTVGIAKVGTTSSRATVPECIVAYFGIEVVDKLRWKMDMQDNERVVAIVTKKSREKDNVELARYSMEQKRNKLSGGVYLDE